MTDSDYDTFQPGEDIRRKRPGAEEPYPRIEYKAPNPALSAEALVAAFEGRQPVIEFPDIWKYLSDDNPSEGSYCEPFLMENPNFRQESKVFEGDITNLEDAYGYVYEYLREFYEKDAPWGTVDDDVLDALERAINFVKKVTGYEDVGGNDD